MLRVTVILTTLILLSAGSAMAQLSGTIKVKKTESLDLVGTWKKQFEALEEGVSVPVVVFSEGNRVTVQIGRMSISGRWRHKGNNIIFSGDITDDIGQRWVILDKTFAQLHVNASFEDSSEEMHFARLR